jgi:hypothetical protein
MQRDQFSQMLQVPHPVSPEQRDDLLELTRNYPWFSAAHVFLAKLDHDHRHIQYHTHLKRAAVYAPDREVLYKLLMKPQLQATVEAFDAACEAVEETAAPLELVEREVILLPEPPAPPAPADAMAAVLEPVQALAENIELDVESQRDAVLEIIEDVKSEIESETEADTDTEIETEIEVPAALVEADSEVDEPVVEEEAPALPIMRAGDFDDLQREILLEAITSSIEREVSESDSERLPTKAAEQPQAPEPIADHLSAYTRWMLQKSSDVALAATAHSAPSTTAPVDLREKQRNLIDTFIQNDPKISKGKVEMFSTENLARMSLVEDERFVTETMAAIYARQGHVRKAVKAYQLLALNYPEKSVYFANQIKKLQERR